jgi:hypothetical protein
MTNNKPDVLRVVEFIQSKSAENETFSINEASKSTELNGIAVHRIAEIMRSICLEPNGPDTLEKYTTVNGDYPHSNPGRWELKPDAYFGYLGYQSNQHAEKALILSKRAFGVAIATLVLSSIIPFVITLFDKYW